MSLTFGFFPEFKGDDTLLIWGSHGFEKLRDLFETVANQSMKSVDFDDTAYLTRAGSCSVSISCTKMDHGKFNIATDGSQTVITCYLNLDIELPQPFQIIVSKGEYPEDLEPDK